MSAKARARRKAAWRLTKFGGWFSDACTAWSVAIDPTLFPHDTKLRTRSLWPGVLLIVVALLALVPLFQVGSWVIAESHPRREILP